jgi:hypothetical protein
MEFEIDDHLHTLIHMNFPNDIRIYYMCTITYFVQQKQGYTSRNNIKGLIIFHIYMDNNTNK